MSGLAAPRRGDAASDGHMGHDGEVSPPRASTMLSKTPLWLVGAVACLLAVGVYAVSATGATDANPSLPGAVSLGSKNQSGVSAGTPTTGVNTSPPISTSKAPGVTKPSSKGSGTNETRPNTSLTTTTVPRQQVVSPNMPVVSSNDDGSTELIVPTTNPEGETDGHSGSESGGDEVEHGQSSGSTEN